MVNMRFTESIASTHRRSLAAWLDILERQHPSSIDLGLDRVGQVWRRLGAPRPARRVITVGGTNGKGSVVAFLDAAATANGWRVGAYTSPHIHRYNERIRINGADAQDSDLVRCFEQIDAVRGNTTLTYFEVGTLAALSLMAQSVPPLDLAILEVGLGGRLDAVNIIDADVAIVTTVALDHQAWLGDTRARIAHEKAAIARRGRPLIIGERNPEPALLATAESLGARPFRLGVEFDWSTDGLRRLFRFGMGEPVALPPVLPLSAPCQFDNASTALAALAALMDSGVKVQPVDAAVAAHDDLALPTTAAVPDVPVVQRSFDLSLAAGGLVHTQLAGRLEKLSVSPEIVVDVGHNPQAASMLADWLAGAGADKITDAVFSALADKDIEGIVAPLASRVRHWYLAGLDQVSPRGLDAIQIAERVGPVLDVAQVADGATGTTTSPMSLHATVSDALEAAIAHAASAERVLVFGSFHVVDEARTSLRGRL